MKLHAILLKTIPTLYQPFAVILPQKFTCSAFAQGLAAENVLLTMQNNFNLLCVSFSTPWFAAERKKTLNKQYKSFFLVYQNLVKNIFLTIQTKIYTLATKILSGKLTMLMYAIIIMFGFIKYSLKFVLA